MKRLLLLMIVFFGGIVQVVAENTLFYDSKQLTCDLITSICQDKDGFIWIGTDYGLNKFNGIQFTHYYNNPKDSTSLSDNSVKALMLDNEGTLWVGGIGGLQYYVPEENAFRTIKFEESSSFHIMCITQLRSGEIWVGSSGRGIFRIRKDTGTGEQMTDIPDVSEHAHYGVIYEDRHGSIWIGVNGTGLLRYDPSTRTSKIYTRAVLDGGSTISGMAEDHSGNFLLSTGTTAYYYDRENDRFTKIEHNESWLPARSILVSQKGTRYLATFGKGLKVIQPDLKELRSEVITLPFIDVNNAKIRAIYEDHNQNLWIGCYHRGMVMVSKESTPFHFWSVPTREYPQAGVITALYKDDDGHIVSGVEGEGVFKITSEGNITDHLFSGKTVSSIYKDYSGNLWFGGYYSGLYMQDAKGNVRFMLPEIKLKDIKKITGDDKGNLYLSLFGSGFIRYHLPTQTVTEYQSSSGGLRNNWIYTLLLDSRERLWIGHCNGVDYFDPVTEKFTPVLSQSLGNFITYSLLEDVRGNIWAGTNKGLMCYHPGTKEFHYYDEEDGLSNNFVYGLAEDERGNIWCSTLKGINLIKVAENKIASYYSERGLVDNEYTIGASYQSMNGLIYLGGVKGITTFHPDSVTAQKGKSTVILSNLYLGGEAVTAKSKSGGKPILDTFVTRADKISLAYEDNTFTLEFSTLDYRNSGNIFYEYRIREYEKNWTSTQLGINQITYNHLNSGKYTFEIRACENGQYTPVKVIRIDIAAPWWRSSLAYVCYALILLAVAFQIYLSVRRRHQKEMNEERIKLFINLSHEIRSPMTLIVSPLENLLKRDYDADTMKMLRLMQKNANRIINLMNQLLDMRKIEKGQLNIHCVETDMVDYIKELISLFTYQAEKRNINLCFDYEQEELPAWIDPNNFDKVLVNLLSNAFKYTPDGGEIKISLREKVNELTVGDLQHFIEIEVIDSGSGIDANKLEKIFERFYQIESEHVGSGIGLSLVQRLVELHHGRIELDSEEGKGSTFSVYLPQDINTYKSSELASNDTLNEEGQVYSTNSKEMYFIDTEKVENETIEAGDKKRGTILIVEDNNEIRHYLSSGLAELFNTLEAGNGEEALEKLKDNEVDIIVTDVMMPVMDGIKLCKNVKQNIRTCHIPVIILSAKSEVKDQMEGLQMGADDYIPKPFSLAILTTKIQNMMRTRRRMLERYSKSLEVEPEKITFNAMDEALLKRAVAIVEKNMDNIEFSTDEFAREMNMSRSNLHLKLKAITGESTIDFIRKIRFNEAAKLLKDGRYTIAEVSTMVGFNTPSYFATSFKKYFGCLPTEYIKKIKG